MENQGLPRALVMGIVGLIFVVLFGSSMFKTIDPGEKGILFHKFSGGLDKETIYGQGFHVIAPWNTLYIYDVKIHVEGKDVGYSGHCPSRRIRAVRLEEQYNRHTGEDFQLSHGREVQHPFQGHYRCQLCQQQQHDSETGRYNFCSIRPGDSGRLS